MSKTTKILIALGAVAVASGIAYYYISKNKPAVGTDTITSTSTKSNGLVSLVSPLAALF